MLDADLPHGQLWLPRACSSFTSRTFGTLSVCSNAALPSPRVRVRCRAAGTWMLPKPCWGRLEELAGRNSARPRPLSGARSTAAHDLHAQMRAERATVLVMRLDGDAMCRGAQGGRKRRSPHMGGRHRADPRLLHRRMLCK